MGEACIGKIHKVTLVVRQELGLELARRKDLLGFKMVA